MNRVELVGSLLDVPKYHADAARVSAARFTLIVPDVTRDPETRRDVIVYDYIGCRLFGPLAHELAEQAPVKGEQLYVLGKLDQRQEPDAEGSLDKAKTRVRVAFVQRLAPRPPPAV